MMGLAKRLLSLTTELVREFLAKIHLFARCMEEGQQS